MKNIIRAMSSAGVLGVLAATALTLPSTASAVDVGGNGNPVNCPDSFTYRSKDIRSAGRTIGRVEMKWSNQCRANWTKTTSYIGKQDIVSHVWKQANEGYRAFASNHWNYNYTMYINAGPTEAICSNGAIHDPAVGYFVGTTFCAT